MAKAARRGVDDFYPGQRVRVVNGTGRIGVVRERYNEHGFMVKFATSRELKFVRTSELEAE